MIYLQQFSEFVHKQTKNQRISRTTKTNLIRTIFLNVACCPRDVAHEVLNVLFWIPIRDVGSERGWGGVRAPPPQVLTYLLTLSQPGWEGGTLCQPHYYLPPPRIFRSSYGPASDNLWLYFETIDLTRIN